MFLVVPVPQIRIMLCTTLWRTTDIDGLGRQDNARYGTNLLLLNSVCTFGDENIMAIALKLLSVRVKVHIV